MSDFDKISKLTELQHLNAQAKLRELVAHEGRLRAHIANLRAQVAEVDTEKQLSMRQIGADMLWRQWVERMLVQLNTELAQVLAQKERHMTNVRRSFGRVQVSATLAERHRQKTQKAKAQRELDTAIDAALQTPAEEA